MWITIFKKRKMAINIRHFIEAALNTPNSLWVAKPFHPKQGCFQKLLKISYFNLQYQPVPTSPASSISSYGATLKFVFDILISNLVAVMLRLFWGGFQTTRGTWKNAPFLYLHFSAPWNLMCEVSSECWGVYRAFLMALHKKGPCFL